MNKELLKEQNLVIPAYLIKVVKKFDLTTEAFLVLCYFWNFKESCFDVKVISEKLHLDENEILEAFNILICKKIIELKTIKNDNGKREEVINLDNLYCFIDDSLSIEKKETEKEDIFGIFEQEFGRPISSMEYEIINAWLEKDFSEELILGALKEAVYNGVNNLRYIDKILYDWQKKGYKTMKEVNSHNFNRKNKEEKELFDYNWLDDNEG